MLFSDRDFGADDYEALLALDEGIDNRKGAIPFHQAKDIIISNRVSSPLCVS